AARGPARAPGAANRPAAAAQHGRQAQAVPGCWTGAAREACATAGGAIVSPLRQSLQSATARCVPTLEPAAGTDSGSPRPRGTHRKGNERMSLLLTDDHRLLI